MENTNPKARVANHKQGESLADLMPAELQKIQASNRRHLNLDNWSVGVLKELSTDTQKSIPDPEDFRW